MNQTGHLLQSAGSFTAASAISAWLGLATRLGSAECPFGTCVTGRATVAFVSLSRAKLFRRPS